MLIHGVTRLSVVFKGEEPSRDPSLPVGIGEQSGDAYVTYGTYIDVEVLE